jgi:DNA-binding transcriptional MerR regulator
MENMSVKALVRLIGINENTLRGWERRYQAVTPLRDEEGRRLYSSKDVERIKILWALVKEGHSIGRIAQEPTLKLKKMLTSTISPQVPELTAHNEKTETYLTEIISALEKFNLEKLNQTLLKARFEISSKEIAINLIRPLMVKVGWLIEENKLSITQEHILSALLRDYLGNLYQSLSPYDFSSRVNERGVLLTTREGDIHEFGILLAGIFSNLYRYRTYYLGPNMPVDDLIEACSNFKIDFIILGMMTLPKEREIVSSMDYLKKLDLALPRKISFCLGGTEAIEIQKLRSDRQVFIIKNLEELDQFLSRNR